MLRYGVFVWCADMFRLLLRSVAQFSDADRDEDGDTLYLLFYFSHFLSFISLFGFIWGGTCMHG